MRTLLGHLTCVCLILWVSACSSTWTEVRVHDGWTLYESERAVDPDAFAAAFDPAIRAVEQHFGAFERNVRVHAWNGAVELGASGRGVVHEDQGDGVQEVPGIGPARIQAYHSRGSGGPFARNSGIFIGAPDAGTAAHELVHARLAELGEHMPLWFEEGIATIFGDGALVDGRWCVDGLACWPWRELRENQLSDQELAALLALEASDAASVRDNVLAHFVGWAIVFDLMRETGSLDWRVWRRTFDWQAPLRDARARLTRTLDEKTPLEWLSWLEHEEPARRLAAVKGMWKLKQRSIVDALTIALGSEADPEVSVGLAINLLASMSGGPRLDRRTWRRARNAIDEALSSAELSDPAETRAARELVGRGNWNSGDERERALDVLRRFWDE